MAATYGLQSLEITHVRLGRPFVLTGKSDSLKLHRSTLVRTYPAQLFIYEYYQVYFHDLVAEKRRNQN